ncbi:MAG: hypothetical protein ACNI27_00630 [Desulfovibrio sp.]
MSHYATLINFTRDTLGYRREHEFYESIECSYQGEGTHPVPDLRKYVINGELLIHIVDVDNPAHIERIMKALIEAGMEDMEDNGYDDFAAVLATDFVSGVKSTALELFEEMDLGDDVQLHIVSKPLTDFL